MPRSKIVVVLVYVIHAMASISYAQQDGRSLMLFGGLQRSTYSLDRMKDLFSQVKGTYRGQGIPVPDQVDYPGNTGFTAGILFPVSYGLSLGPAVDYGTTAAFSAYGDIAGTVDIISHVWVTNASLVLRYLPAAKYWISPLLQLQIGAAFVKLNLKQRIESEDRQMASESYVGVEGIMLHYAGNAGIAFSVDRFVLVARVGLRFCESDSLEGESSLDGQQISKGPFPTVVDLGGVDLGIELGICF